jgi:hypothetical protein
MIPDRTTPTTTRVDPILGAVTSAAAARKAAEAKAAAARAAAAAKNTQNTQNTGNGNTTYHAPVTPVTNYPTGAAPVVAPALKTGAADYQVDPEYLAAKGAYDNIYNQLGATLNRETSNYNKDYGTALGNMGWLGSGEGWDTNNIETAAGRGNRNLMDDFAARGMLRGTGFGEAKGSLDTSLQKQLDQLIQQKQQFSDAQSEKLTQGDQTRDNNIKMAAAQALARLAAGYLGTA